MMDGPPQRAPIDMQFRGEKCDCGLFKKLDDKKNCRRENQKSPAVAETIGADKQPFYPAHSSSTAPMLQLR